MSFPAQGMKDFVDARQSNPADPVTQATEESILTARFQKCSCGVEDYPQVHASIQISPLSLTRGHAAAISYTYGAFDRQYRPIGHFHDRPDEAVTLELGMEWELDKLIERLIQLSEEYQALWLDQLCFKPKFQGVQAGLAKIPLIYKTLEVVVLLPGSTCVCLEKAVKDFEGGGGYRVWRNGEYDLDLDKVSAKCFNTFAISSYFDRLWTHQEIAFATSFRIVWTHNTPYTCVSFFRENSEANEPLALFNLSLYAQTTYDKAFNKWQEAPRMELVDEMALVKLSNKMLMMLGSLEHVLRHKLSNDKSVKFRWDLEEAKVLLGKKVKDTNEQSESVTASFANFIVTRLGWVGSSTCAATFKRDYAYAVWLDCPFSRFPTTDEDGSAGMLIDSQLNRVESRLGLWIVSCLPLGLFQDSATFRWRPSAYLRDDDIKSASDVYGLCKRSHIFPLSRDNKFFFRSKESVGKSRLSRAVVYRSIFGQLPTQKALDVITAIWKGIEPVARDLLATSEEDQIEYLTKAATICSSGRSVSRWEHPDIGLYAFWLKATDRLHKSHEGWNSLPEIDHYDALYRLVAYKFYLNVDVARSKGLQLVLIPDEPGIIGFTRLPDLDIVDMSQTLSLQLWRQIIKEKEGDDVSENQYSLVYELLRADDLDSSALGTDCTPYRVVGVWLESAIADEDCMGNDLESKLPANAVIV